MNPYQAIMGAAQMGQNPLPQQRPNNVPSMDWNALMGQLQANPAEMIRKAGYNVPDEISGNPQAAVMHMLRTGQIGGPMMQRIAPMLQKMGVR